MSAFDNLKLAMIPSGFKEDKLYSALPQPVVTSDNILTEPLDIDADFNNNSGGVIVDANTFTTAGGSLDGILGAILVVGKNYKLEIKGTTTSNGFTIGDGAASGNEYGSGFGVHYFTAAHANLWIRQNTAGTTDITTFTIKEVDQVPADFTFTRGSDSTRVNPQGLVESVQILGSNVITTGEFNSQSDVDFWQIATTSGTPRATKTLVNGFMRLTFDLANGSALFKGSTAVPLGRYKVTFRAKGTANSNFRSIGDNNSIQDNPEYAIINPTLTSEFQNYEFVIDLTSSSFRIYLTTAQVGDTLDIDDIVILPITDDTDIPRLDYSDGTCPSLLLEPQRTNLFPTSVDFDGATALNSTLTTVSITSPEGLTIGVHEVTATSTTQPRVEEFLTVPTGDKKYVWSVFVKKNTARYVGLSHFNQNSNRCIFDLDNGTIVSDSGTDVAAKIQNFGNGWFRISKGANIPSGSEAGNFKAHLCTETDVFTGVSGESAYFFGLQIEQGSYATSYIPTRGTTVTRDGELWENTNLDDTIDTANGFTFFMETNATEITEVGFSEFFAFRVSTANDDSLRMEMRSNATIGVFSEVSNFSTLNDTNQFVIGQENKIAIVITNNVQKLFVNGVLTSSFTNSITLPTFEHLRLERSVGQAAQMKFAIKSMLLFEGVLTDQQCIDLTT